MRQSKFGFFAGMKIGLLSLGLVAGGFSPAVSAPSLGLAPGVSDTGIVQFVQSNRHRPRPPQAQRPRPRPPHAQRPRPRPPQARPSRPGHWNGHRGSRTYRSGWRRHSDGWWYPLAAFTAGAIIGGAVTQPRPASPAWRHNDAHLRWCHDRFRSFRASDNTFQPYNGPRRQCISPYL